MKLKKNIAMLSLIGILAPINAYSLSITLNTEFSGGAVPSGFPTISILQGANADTVNVLITSNLISGTEFIDEVVFNYGGANPLVTGLTATFTSGQAATDGIFFGSNAFKADGAGYFDIKFDYEASNNSNRFTAGETSAYTLSVASGLGLSPDDFSFLSTASAKGSFGGAAHVQGIATAPGSGWVGGPPIGGPNPPDPEPDPVPEPTAVWMLGLGLLGLVGYKRKQCKLAA